MPKPRVPEIQRRETRTTLPDYGEEKELEGYFEGSLDELAQYLKQQGVVVVLPNIQPDEDGTPYTVRVRFGGVPASIALRQVADQLPDNPTVIRRSKDIYIVGKPDSKDLISRVFYVPGKDAEQYLEVIKALTSDNARVATVDDALVVRDTIDGIRDVSQLFDTLGAARAQWVVEVQFIELTHSAASAVGLDWSVTGEAELTAGTDLSDFEIAARIATILQLEASDRIARVLTTSRVHVLEGRDATLQVGETTPVINRAVSDAGTVTPTEIEFIDTGVIVDVSVRSEPDGRVRVILEPEISQVIGFIDDAPIRSRRRISTAAVIDEGGVVIVGGFEQQQERTTRDGLPGLLNTQAGKTERKDDDHTRVYVMLRVIDPTTERQAAPPAAAQNN